MTLFDRTADPDRLPSVTGHQPSRALPWFVAVVGGICAAAAIGFAVNDQLVAAGTCAGIAVAAFAGGVAITISINVRRHR
ncbi:hypothetical protein ACFY72_34975 [Streptomyces globisporus]|uniref:hypothetical protein n=1 Tax=Streptomyces globisporus TaxID=1908 RepID=UPI0036916D1B